MATTLNAFATARANPAETTKNGFWKRFAAAFVAHRTSEARREIAVHLSHLSDAQLADYGWSKQDIRRLRGA